jgi:hypothetical protein
MNQFFCDISKYEIGKTMYWTKFIRANLEPSFSLAFAGQGGYLFAVELDYGLPHLHLKVGNILDKHTVHQAGVYLFPWFCFTVKNIIKTPEVTLIHVKQSSWPLDDERQLTFAEIDETQAINYSKVKLLRENKKDVFEVAMPNLVESIEKLSDLFDPNIA